MIKNTASTVIVSLWINSVLYFTRNEATNHFRESRDCLGFSENVTIADQQQWNEFIQNSSPLFSRSNSDDVSNCIKLSFIGKSFQLDLLQLMRINLGTNGSLVIMGNSVNLNCYVNITDEEELRKSLQPISRALLIFFDGLVFTKCPVPIVIEEVTNVIIQNCVFM